MGILATLFRSSQISHPTASLHPSSFLLCTINVPAFAGSRRYTIIRPRPLHSDSTLSIQSAFRCVPSTSASHFGILRPSRVFFASHREGLHNSSRISRKKTPTRRLIAKGNAKTTQGPEPSSCSLSRAKRATTIALTRATAGNVRVATPLSSPSRMKPSFYAVAVGKQRGIYSTWDQCSEQVKGYSGAIYKSFRSLSEARAFLTSHPAPGSSELLERGDSTASNIPQTQADVKVTRQRGDEDTVLEAATTSAPPRQRLRVEEGPTPMVEPERRARSSHHQVVHVDGACSHNGTPRARAGYGGFYGSPSDARNFSLPVPSTEAQTNNRGELRAVIHSIVQGFVDAGAPRAALDMSHCVAPDWRLSELPEPLHRLVIYTDSRYVIDGLTRYSPKWVDNGFKLVSKEPVLNQDLWKQVIRLRDAYNNRYAEQQHRAAAQHPYMQGRELSPARRFTVHNTRNDETEGVELRHVKGHSNDYGNEMADTLAVSGSRMHDRF